FPQKGEAIKLALLLTRIMFPAVLFMALAGLAMGILNSYEHFTAPAIAPVLWNLVIILMVVFASSRWGVVSLALGITLGSLVQFLFQLPFIRKREARYSLILNWRHPGVKEVGALIIPVVLSLASTEINVVVDTRFASTLVTGSIASLGYAVRLWTLPISLFAIAAATVLFPSFSRLAAKGDIKGLRQTFSQGIRMVFSILIPASVGLMVLCIPIVRLIFERGEFTKTSTLFTAGALFYYSIGIFAAGGLHLVNRTFYSIKDTRTPMIVTSIAIIINYFGDWFLMKFLPATVQRFNVPLNLQWLGYAHGGIALSTSLVCFFNFFILVEILRRRLGGIEGKKIFLNFVKVSLASVALGFFAYYSWKVTALKFGISTSGQLISVGSGIFAGILAYLICAYHLRIEEVSQMKKLILERFK
ncbi:MAG: murein biosynthesis integral membrane protein MurJ, partial [Candidatus Subteraquimicrobiales bacterium]|nr:murein biosynthesis integral membrane protein MurJ [Candidatus Subteraquimicrobiales bacterium]